MANEWYCRIMGEEWGPMSAEELMAVARWGRLTRDDIVRCGKTGTWIRAELVRGLFDSPRAAATVSSVHRQTAGSGASPAQRSVQSFVPTQYWVKIGQIGSKAAGPFSARKIRQFAEQGVLKPNHLVSNDGRLWARACNVEGLVFGVASPTTETISACSAESVEQPPTSSDSPTAEDLYYDAGVEGPNQVEP